MNRIAVALVLAAAASSAALGQEISDLPAGRPVTIEDATPLAWQAFSFSADWASAQRNDGVNYSGPAFSLLYGVARGVEAGVETRLLTHPHLNAERGIGSGDLDVHALGALLSESTSRPALAVRADVFLPTGVASHGTNLSGEVLATRSFDAFRLHANAGFLYVGDTRPEERRERLFAVFGGDVAPLGPWNTDTLLVGDLFVRQSVGRRGHTTAGAEIGVRQRMGMQTLIYAGLLKEFSGEGDRVRYRGLIGLTHAF